MNFFKKAFHFFKKNPKNEIIEQFEIDKDNIPPDNKDFLEIYPIINNKNTNNEKNNNNNIFKLIIILFLLYIFISSKFFTSTILKLCGGSRFVNNNNHPTLLGNILQGIFLVIFYMLLAHLVKKGVI